jgi:hypothetical protein
MYVIDSHGVILHVENPFHLVLPKHQSPHRYMVHIGCLKFAAERNIVPNRNAVPKKAHQEKPLEGARKWASPRLQVTSRLLVAQVSKNIGDAIGRAVARASTAGLSLRSEKPGSIEQPRPLDHPERRKDI